MKTLLAIAVTLGAVCHTARADEAAPRTTISVPLLGLPLHGVTVEVERDVPAWHVSLVGALTVRSTAAGDYDSRSLGLGAEVRYWFKRDAIWTTRARGSAVGWYVAGRLDLTHTTLTDEMDEDLGAIDTIAVAALAGYRFAPWRGVEVRPYAGLSVRHDHGGGPDWTRPGLAYGLAAGWSF